ncbi:ATP-binding protein [Streptomyces sp. NPDC058417]|uniref:ATP-binding protein n=1 Tax=unclassified Streptomyces TaxID=2593676 RepID=UPI003656187B
MTSPHRSRRTTSAVCPEGLKGSGLPQTFKMTFPADPGCAQQARRVIDAHLRYWGRSSFSDAVLLATTEAFANAATHGSRNIGDVVTVEVENTYGCLRVSISDASPDHLPIVPADVDPLAESGRGLALIETYTDAWGVKPADGLGKTVWFTFNTSADVSAPRTSPLRLPPVESTTPPLPSRGEGKRLP